MFILYLLYFNSALNSKKYTATTMTLIMHLSILISSLLLLLVSMATASTVYHIGVLVNNASLDNTIINVKNKINANAGIVGLGTSRLNVTWLELVNDPVQATKDICDHLISNSVYVVITTNAINSTKSPDIVSYACAFYKIPTIVVQSRNTELSDKVKVLNICVRDI